MKLIKTIRSRKGILHFKRWELLKTPWFSIYIHGIYKEDQDKHLHNHPWKIFTLILKGSYIEQLETRNRKRFPGHFGYLGLNKFHKIQKIVKGPVYTLAIVSKPLQSFGFLVDNKVVEAKEYRVLKHKGAW